MENYGIAYFLMRLGVAMSMFGHGLVRLPKLHGFSGWMMKSFENAMLPPALVQPFSYTLPIAEFIVGLFLLLGLFTRYSLIAGSVVMITLIFGTTLIENWDALPSQLIHLGLMVVLLIFIQYNYWSADRVFKL
ncbi:DoxX family membrane protein [Chitinophaga silvatica]|uniref:DoxX family membrane protein n=1 Tax=Chitinophaga silvatica TaxID=2282649 RepID=A0A3E1YCC7_9BACT|nr:DoxX family membrane protein [Chitinophaga silvatica]RFS23899.1 DoxX family membrane protein [Chitinophaga silvatica]